MAQIIRLPDACWQRETEVFHPNHNAMIVILPIIRIERVSDGTLREKRIRRRFRRTAKEKSR